MNSLYEAARLTFLLATSQEEEEEERGVELLEQHLDLMVFIGRVACELCNQIRVVEDEVGCPKEASTSVEASGRVAKSNLLTCGGCGVARYCH